MPSRSHCPQQLPEIFPGGLPSSPGSSSDSESGSWEPSPERKRSDDVSESGAAAPQYSRRRLRSGGQAPEVKFESPQRSGKQPQKFPSEARWTEYVWERPQTQLPSLRNYISTQDQTARGTPPPHSMPTPYSGSSESRARNRDSYGQYECVAVERLEQITFLGLTQADANDIRAFRHSMRISDEPGQHKRTSSGHSLAGTTPREGPSRTRPDLRYHTERPAYPSGGLREFGQDLTSRPQSVYERTPQLGPSGLTRPGYGPGAEQSPFDQRRQQHAAMSSDPRYAHYASQPVGNYSWDAPRSMDNPGSRKRRGNLPKESTSILNDWFNQHAAFPYPKEDEKQQLQAATGLSISQVSLSCLLQGLRSCSWRAEPVFRHSYAIRWVMQTHADRSDPCRSATGS